MSDKAEKPDKKADAKDAGHGEGDGEKAAKKGGLFTKLPVLLGGVMVLEAVVLFAGFKMFGGSPKAAHAEVAAADGEKKEGEEGGDKEHAKPEGEGADAHGGHEEAAHDSGGHDGKPADGGGAIDPKKLVVVKILEYKFINKRDGRAVLYDIAIHVTTRGKFKKRLEETVSDRDPMIKDRVRTLVAQSDPEKLGGGSEPGLETFRRQVKYQLDEIVGEGLIDEVLVPRCIPYRAD